MIRPYQPSDKPALLAIFKLNTPTYFDPKEITDYEQYLDAHAASYLTILYNDTIAGGTGYHIIEEGTAGQITWIFFHPDYAGKGLGRKAVEYCLAMFRSTPTVKRSIVTTSQLAWQFFGKFGYELVRTEKDYWGPGLDLYLMEMNL